jgi:uncharacterized membrane protein YphA (DoxX/SURF4 family)
MKTNIKNTIILIIRILAGGLLTVAGYMKLSNMDATIAMMTGLTGLSAGYIWAVSLGEVATGLGILFGVWTRLASLGAIIIMIGAVYYTKGQDMKAILTLIAVVILAVVGGGKWALVTWRSKQKPIVGAQTELPKF